MWEAERLQLVEHVGGHEVTQGVGVPDVLRVAVGARSVVMHPTHATGHVAPPGAVCRRGCSEQQAGGLQHPVTEPVEVVQLAVGAGVISHDQPQTPSGRAGTGAPRRGRSRAAGHRWGCCGATCSPARRSSHTRRTWGAGSA